MSARVPTIVVCITLFLTAGWYSQEILRFGEAVFDHFYGI